MSVQDRDLHSLPLPRIRGQACATQSSKHGSSSSSTNLFKNVCQQPEPEAQDKSLRKRTQEEDRSPPARTKRILQLDETPPLVRRMKAKVTKDEGVEDAIEFVQSLQTLRLKADSKQTHQRPTGRPAGGGDQPERIITTGSDCSGLGTELVALKLLKVPARSLFGSEINPKVRELHRLLHQDGHGGAYTMYSHADPSKSYVKIKKPVVDLYVAGPPCQSFSPLGARLGLEDFRGVVFYHVLCYLKDKRPRCVVIENVKALSARPHVRDFAVMLRIIQAEGYHVTWHIMDAQKHGLPQSRQRLYIVAVQKGQVVNDFSWPQDLKILASVDRFISHTAPRPLNLTSETARQAVKLAREKLKARGLEGNGLTTIVDIHASRQYVTVKQDACPCITATRGRQQGFLILTQNRLTSIQELGRLQGFPTCVIDKLCRDKQSSIVGHALGNAMAVNILVRILPRLLHSAGLLPEAIPDIWKKAANIKKLKRLPDDLYAEDALQSFKHGPPRLKITTRKRKSSRNKL